MAISYEEMVPAAQEAFNKENNLRIKVLKATWVGLAAVVVGIVLLIIGGFISVFTGSIPTSIKEFSFSMMIIGIIPLCILGIVHSKFTIKKIWNATPVIVFNWVFAVIALTVVLTIACLCSMIYVVKDTVRYFQKKPLVYSSEHNEFMKTREAQQEIAYYNAVNTAYDEEIAKKEADNAAVEESLVKLKEMYDNSLISADEYERKKSELLNRM